MLAEIHRGEKNGPKWEHTELRTYRYRRALVLIAAERLNLTGTQTDRAIARATNVDAEKLGEALELLIYCTCSYVVHNDESAPYAIKRKCHYNTSDENMDNLFLEVAEEYELTEREIRRVYAKLEQRFTNPLPPVGFDERKPELRPNKYPDRTIVANPPDDTFRTGIWSGI